MEPFEDLDTFADENELKPHANGFRLQAPSSRYETRYECIRCQKTRSGPRMCAVVFGIMRVGVCINCATDAEDLLACRLPSPVHMRVRKEKESQGKILTRKIMEAARTHDAEVAPQPLCDKCKQPAVGGRTPSHVDTTKLLCGVCYSEETQVLFKKSIHKLST